MHTIETLRARIRQPTIRLTTGSGRTFDASTAKEPRIYCSDGFNISVQAGAHLYCEPREHGADWTSVELSFPSAPIPDLAEYRDGHAHGDDVTDEESVFCYVPIEKVVELINAHGGEVDAPPKGDAP